MTNSQEPKGCAALRQVFVLAVASAMLAATACEVHQSGFDDPLEQPPPFVEFGEAPIPDQWWRTFDDPTLNALQDSALDANFDLATARDRLRAARAIVRREDALRYPAVDFNVFAEQTRRESNDFSPNDLFGGGLVATYEVDLWNRIDSQVDRAKFDRAAAREELKAAAITLSGNVAATWYALVQQRGQRFILQEQIQTNEQVLEVVRKRFGRGLVRASDVLRQERLLESTREQRAAVQSQIEVLEHQLLVLLGRSPTEQLEAAGADLPSVPTMPEVGLPSELIQRRPDVRAAYFAIEAADRNVAIAVADRYPSLTIGASASVSGDKVSVLFDDWVQTLSADLLGPVFDAGRRKAEVDRTRAVKAQRIDQYAQTILIAFRQVADALSREVSREEQIRFIESQLDLAQRTSERLRREYLNGDISYIDVLDALTREQQLQRDLLQARFQRIADRISLYQALAGGWDGIVPPADDQS